ncbi:hypothetical protein B0T13DRAFT_525613 [Neurospora crassa]|nr:hypothetical protein B0T13DRAFT_525613 [Neurospora crassa]
MSNALLRDEQLLLLIFSQVIHQADYLSLRQTCRSFEAVASQYLFRQVAVSPVGNDLATFLRVAYSPRLSRHVQELIWLELDCPTAEANSLQQWPFPHISVPAWDQMFTRENSLFWHSYSPLDVPSGNGEERSYSVHDGLLPVFLEAIARMPKLRTFTSTSMDFEPFQLRCGREITVARSRDLQSQRWKCASRSPPIVPGEDSRVSDVLLKGTELYVLPALAQKSAVGNRWLQLHWLDSTYFEHKVPQIPLQLRHVPPISEALVQFTFSIGMVDCPPGGELERRQRHLEMQYKLLACLANARNLRILRLTAYQRFPNASSCAKKTGDLYFFDLLVGQKAGPNSGEIYLPHLSSLSLESIMYSQASLEKFIARHADTLRVLELSDCRLEFDTVKRLATMGLQLNKFEVTSVRYMIQDMRRTRDGPYRSLGGRWTRVFEFITPEGLLGFVNGNTTPEAQWANLEPTRFGRIPYQAYFNFLVTTEDVRSLYRVQGAYGHLAYGDEFERRWEKLVQEGKGIDFRQPSHPEIARCLGDEHGEGLYRPNGGVVIYPTGETPEFVTSDLALLKRLKLRALELSLSPEHVEEVQRLMESCKREEAEVGDKCSF